jgi:NAD dependent epimerase/dehydratase family enzyme
MLKTAGLLSTQESNRPGLWARRSLARRIHQLYGFKQMLEIGAIFIRTETELILKSRRVIPRRLQESGFSFLFPAWAEAARDLCKRWREING